MREFDHREIERKWKAAWESASKGTISQKKTTTKKSYLLVEFPYPSGSGLHTGHVRSYTAMDVVARKRRGEGEDVLYPIGWDAFGLPTENYAIKTGKDPRDVTKENTDTFRRQLKSLGISFDWEREINTTDPRYYKWTQWIFLQLFKKGLAYKAKTAINWCPKCKIGLANEEVVDGACERCGHSPVEKREKEQWMLAITKYAQRLYDDLDTVDYIERAKVQQRNWIGPSEGAELEFEITNQSAKIKVFTTRPDTLYGVTYLVLAPEHPLVAELKQGAENEGEIDTYVADARKKTEIERSAEGREKTGVELKGVRAKNPANSEELPIWVADYVLATYGTGAIMAVPAHDERDYAFAQKFSMPVKKVVQADDDDRSVPYTGRGTLVNSDSFSGMASDKVNVKIIEHVGGIPVTRYKLRDWVFSRQRYWGEPIPMVYCKKDGWVPVPEHELPVELPHVAKYEPTDTGESPLATMEEWVATTCPVCGGLARRETDVMPNWAGSSWYYLRYCDPHNEIAFADKTKLAYWTPVDWYNGGMEHTVLHLLYSRFWHKFLYDIGVVPTSEPYTKRTSHGLILAEGGEKMSKSKGNVVNPDDIVERFGADSLRVYEMFMGPFDQAIAWSEDGLVGARRFLERVVKLSHKVEKEGGVRMSESGTILLHTSIQKVSDDIEQLKMNTAVSQLMILTNALEKEEKVSTEAFDILVRLLAPFAPFLTEELWSRTGHTESVHHASWPTADEKVLAGAQSTVVVQVNGKTRGSFSVPRGTPNDTLIDRARELPGVLRHTEGRIIEKTIVVPDRLVNFVVGCVTKRSGHMDQHFTDTLDISYSLQ